MFKRIKRIGVFGIGGIGGYFGGKIANRINKDNLEKEVYFIARGEHLAKIQEKGLKVITDNNNEEFKAFPNIATDSIKKIPTPDIYLLCVKGYDLKNAVIEIGKNMNKDTIILPLLNGVDIYERIRDILSEGIVIPAAVYVSSSIEQPGVIRQKGPEGRIVYGRDPQHINYNYDNLKELFSDIHIRADWFDNPYTAIWEKYLFIAAFGLITAYSGKSIGGVLEDEELKNLTENIMREIVLLARAKSIDLKEEAIENSMQIAGGFPYDATTSFQKDYSKGGHRNEGDIFGGTLLRIAKEYNTPIPNITEIYNKLIS